MSLHTGAIKCIAQRMEQKGQNSNFVGVIRVEWNLTSRSVIHIIQMAPQYLYNNDVTYYVIT